MTDETLRALARAAAAGECEARLPISPPLPDDAGPAMLRSVSEPGYQVWKRVNDSPSKRDWYVGRDLPLTPGEVYRAECLRCAWPKELCCGGIRVDLRILSVTPERERCEECGGEMAWRDRDADEACAQCGGEQIVDGEECSSCGGEGMHPSDEVIVCATCRGTTPPWRWWRAEFEVVG